MFFIYQRPFIWYDLGGNKKLNQNIYPKLNKAGLVAYSLIRNLASLLS